VKQQHSVTSANSTATLKIPGQRTNLLPQLRVRQPLLNRFNVGEYIGGVVGSVLGPVLQDRNEVVSWRTLVSKKMLQIHGGNHGLGTKVVT
jgi:hypothetical protein